MSISFCAPNSFATYGAIINVFWLIDKLIYFVLTLFCEQTKLSGPRSATTSPSYTVERCPTFSFSRSEGSLTGQGQGQGQGPCSDVDDINANTLRHQQPGVNRPPCESEGIIIDSCLRTGKDVSVLKLNFVRFFVTIYSAQKIVVVVT